MSQTLLTIELLLLLVGVFGSLAIRSNPIAILIGTTTGVLLCIIGIALSLLWLGMGTEYTWSISWPPPIGELVVGVDSLSAFFLLCVFVVGGLTMIYAAGYFTASCPRYTIGPALAWLHILIVAMVVVVIARDAIVFLVAWEVMFLSSYFLVTFDSYDRRVRAAGFIYLVASHISVVCLFVLFGMLVYHTHSVKFAAFATAPPGEFLATLCFGLSLVGFGIKAGLWPFHSWLPEAHPAAPSPVSALMSGVMIKMGIYGLLRSLTFLGPPPFAWGITLLLLGSISALVGVLLALAQHDLKRLLAYHSVENIGIIVLGIGIGLLGQTTHMPVVAIAGFSGALLHTLNHGLFKGLLFHAAGALLNATGSREIDTYGGLLRRMPITGTLFLIGAVAISGLPPLNGFISEWLIYMGAFRESLLITPHGLAASAVIVIPVLALVGGLAAACFTKVVGIVFLGEPRCLKSAQACEPNTAMRLAMLLGAMGCIAIGILPQFALQLVINPVAVLVTTGVGPEALAFAALNKISLIALLLGVGVIALVIGRYWLLRSSTVSTAVTWDCGYVAPTARMQYTAASFADTVLDPFLFMFSIRTHRTPVEGLFPLRARYDTHINDPSEIAVHWMLKTAVIPLMHLRALQNGPVQIHLLYMFVTLLILLVWQILI